MSIFQKSVINNHLSQLDREQVDKAFEKFNENYSFSKIAEIQKMKEEEYQDGFLRDIFVDVFGYTLKPADNYNLAREFKNQTDGKKADGAILKNNKAIAVIELKSTKTKDLTNVTQQAFNYKNNQPECKYVITSNFQKLRFYIDYSNEYEEFDLFNLQKNDFQLLYLLLQKDSILTDLPLKLKTETKFHEENISDKLYKDYSSFKYKIYNNLVKNNSQYDKLTLFKKSQKFLDRLLFVFFAEDTGLIPPNAISKIVEQWQLFIDNDEYFSLYSRFVKFFIHLDKGHKYKTYDLPAYNGGLFAPDEILDNITIDDEVLKNDALILSSYDYSTEVDVNILGHIFEHSLGEIAAIAATGGQATLSKQPTVSIRKKDGIFYTPKYITQYIVENTIGKLCIEKREKLGILEIEFDESVKTKNGKISAAGKKLFETLQTYKDWLFSLKIIDPACGSGAFLNQALNFLINEHQQIDDIIAELTGEKLRLFDTDKTILEKNLYGVDINEESVEIAKLSLWLRTAQKGRKLSNLNNNIKCGNSLIDDPEVAGEKAFNWQKEFPGVFQKKKKKAWHVTTATHNSRYSQRMFNNFVKLDEPVWLSEEEEIIVTKTIAEIAEEDKLNILAYNICGDHAHLVLVCEEDELPKIVQKIKSMSARTCNIAMGRTVPENVNARNAREHAPLHSLHLHRGKTQSHLWTQKFWPKEITSEQQLQNTIAYIRKTRNKHGLPENKELQPLVKKMTCTREHAFRTEYKGGFDVVIGNPPYGATFSKIEIEYFNKSYSNKSYQLDSYLLFTEKMHSWLKPNKLCGYIMPNTWVSSLFGDKIRKYVFNNFKIQNFIHYKYFVFADATVETDIYILKKSTEIQEHQFELKIVEKDKTERTIRIAQQDWIKLNGQPINIFESEEATQIKNRLSNYLKLGNLVQIIQGTKPFQKGKGIPKPTAEILKEKPFVSTCQKDETFRPLLRGSLMNKYINYWNNDYWISYGDWLAEPRYSAKFDIGEKLVIRQTGDSLIATYDNNQFIVRDNLYVIRDDENKTNLKALLTIINFFFLNWYFQNIINSEKGKAMAQVKRGQLLQLPVPTIKESDEKVLIVKTDHMLSLNKKLQEKATRFINRLKANLEIQKITTKLQKFYDYDFKTFVVELKKQKVKLSLVQQDEWEEYFNSYKSEINQLQIKIEKTDKEIDQMVYQLYDLTDEEITIVENSIK